MRRQPSFQPIDPPASEVSDSSSDPSSHAARVAANHTSVMIPASASGLTSTHPVNLSQRISRFHGTVQLY